MSTESRYEPIELEEKNASSAPERVAETQRFLHEVMFNAKNHVIRKLPPEFDVQRSVEVTVKIDDAVPIVYRERFTGHLRKPACFRYCWIVCLLIAVCSVVVVVSRVHYYRSFQHARLQVIVSRINTDQMQVELDINLGDQRTCTAVTCQQCVMPELIKSVALYPPLDSSFDVITNREECTTEAYLNDYVSATVVFFLFCIFLPLVFILSAFTHPLA